MQVFFYFIDVYDFPNIIFEIMHILWLQIYFQIFVFQNKLFFEFWDFFDVLNYLKN